MQKKYGFLALVLAAVLLLAACSFDSESSTVQSSMAQSGTAGSAAASSTPQQEAGVSVLTGLPLPESMQYAARPVAIMIDNNVRATPQRGVAYADVVVEMAVADGTTLMMAMFTDLTSFPHIGPVSEIEDQFLQIALPLYAIPVFINGSNYAYNLLGAAGGYKVIDGMQLGTTSFWFDEARTQPMPDGYLHEYCWFTDAALMWNGMVALDVHQSGYPIVPMFNFAQTSHPQSSDAHKISVVYSELTAANLTYRADDETYLLVNSNRTADEDGSEKRYTNVLLLAANIAPKADNADYLEYDFSGGTGYYFTGGGVTEVRWEKGSVENPLRIYDIESGEELQLNTGKSYVGIYSAQREGAVSWQSAQQLAEAAA